NNTVTTNEDTAYTFDKTDFNFSDIDGDTLVSVKVTTLEIAGALQLSGVDVTLNQVITKADINAGNLKFVPVANASGTSYDSFDFTVNDGTADSASSYTLTIDVTAVNDDPTNAGSLPSDIVVTEDVSSNVDLSAIDLSDIDAGGSLTVTLTTSTGGNLTATTGGGVTIGGSGTGILTLDGTLADLNTFLNTASNITYLHGTPGTNGDNADTIQVNVNDNGNTGTGGGTDIDLGTANVDIASANADPTIANLAGDGLAYSEGDRAVVIEQGSDVTVTDVDSTDFDTGTRSGSVTAGSDSAEDILAIRDRGSSTGEVSVAGWGVAYEGTLIGSFAGGANGVDLVITLNASANAAAVQALIENITYENTDSDNATTGARTVRFALNDGDGGTSANYDTTVTVSAANHAPTFFSVTGDGSVTTDFGSENDWGQSITVQDDGKILVAGYSSNGSDNDFALSRYNTDGSLDTSFGTGGVVTTAIGSG
ncbi:MAG: hypothetical protein GY926_14805, partial [bacterium]|nr:hypothetical protein [bacterium]